MYYIHIYIYIYNLLLFSKVNRDVHQLLKSVCMYIYIYIYIYLVSKLEAA